MTHEGAATLWQAVIERALRDAIGDTAPSESPNRDRDNARNWLRAVREMRGGFDFACAAVRANAERLRQAAERALEARHGD